MLQIRDFTQEERVKPEYVRVTNRLKYCKNDDVLLGRYGASIGKVLIGKSGAYNVAIMKSIPNTKLIKKEYMKYYFLSSAFQNYILNLGGRAAQAGFSKEDLSILDFQMRDIDSQERIIQELTSIENIITNKNAQLLFQNDLIKSRFILQEVA